MIRDMRFKSYLIQFLNMYYTIEDGDDGHDSCMS